MSISQKQAARKFVEYWTFQRGSEKGEDQQFWNTLLRDVLGVTDVEQHIKYQVPVQLKDTTKFLDAWIPETRVLIEHKSRGVNLDAPQAGHEGMTPYEQAVEYDNARSFDEKARWIVTCNFDEFRIYDRAKPLAPPLTLKLGNLPKEAYRLAFLVNPKEKAVDRELEISVQAGRIVGKIYDALLKQYGDGNADHLAALNRLCVRLVFCLYAEDADIFPKDCFRRFMENTPALFLRKRLIDLFQTLDTPPEKRNPYLEPELCAFPYTNGGLFRNAAESDIPPMTDEIRKLLVGASQFDWRDITPTIFGALFESTLNPVTRRAGGMSYTSVENIHKVIDPLFLSDLTRRVNECSALSPSPSRNRRLLALQAEMASKTFLDPACGSGNFLTETYICLRRLENRIIAAVQQGQSEFDLGLTIKVSIAQFFGIEINDFAASVARVALWIAEAQMRRETAEILHREPDYLPLKDYANIIEANALKVDWPRTDYIIGNPPFVGKKEQKGKKSEIVELFPKAVKRVGNLDYVAGWYARAIEIIRETETKCAFVSTNSIVQGEQVSILWKYLLECGIRIDFAWRTFRWDSESFEKAHVHCVIIGFSQKNSKLIHKPQIFDEEGRCREVVKINGYLIDDDDIFIDSRGDPICDVSKSNYGSFALDDGNYTINSSEYDSILQEDGGLSRYLKLFLGAEELIHGKKRYCLWLKDVSPSEMRRHRIIVEKVERVRAWRLSSSRENTRKLANTPNEFAEIRQPTTMYLAIPTVCSERRRYIPIAYLSPDIIASNQLYVVPNATVYEFGILISLVHMAWMRVVGGRLETRYRYSNGVVYNNFPWPEPTEEQKQEIAATTQSILDARVAHPECTLADLYDDTFMPADLRAAHEANDRAVLAAYGLAPDTSEMDIVSHLFKLYAKKTAGSK